MMTTEGRGAAEVVTNSSDGHEEKGRTGEDLKPTEARLPKEGGPRSCYEAPGDGIEPSLTDSKSAVLPLDDPGLLAGAKGK